MLQLTAILILTTQKIIGKNNNSQKIANSVQEKQNKTYQHTHWENASGKKHCILDCCWIIVQTFTSETFAIMLMMMLDHTHAKVWAL